MMRIPPYNDQTYRVKADSEFLGVIDSLLVNKSLIISLSFIKVPSKQITDNMENIRSLNIQERMENYKKFRIEEQYQWYMKKTKSNEMQSSIWFLIHIFFQVMAIVSMVLRIALPQLGYWPTNIFIVAAGIVLTWSQTNRFQELSSSYSITVMAISSILNQIDNAQTEEQLAEIVIKAENTFSKEHLQWATKSNVK